MGLLGDIYSASDSLKRKVKGLLSDPSGYLEQIGGILSDDRKTTAERQARMIHNPASITQEDVATAMNTAIGFAPLGMTAWHGSPHKFDKFDMSKIGTGEGAQAYGHGLYMAESPEVAGQYAKLGNRYVELNGRPVDVSLTRNAYADNASQAERYAANAFKRFDGDVPSAVAFLSQKGNLAAEKEGAKILKKQASKMKVMEGQTYKVDIPDEAVARFLDWDKPLSQQAPEVQDVLRKIGIPDDMGGKDAYMAIGNYINRGSPFDPQHLLATEALKKRGIPGIRYLDGGSRSAGQGSSNFVLFDDQLPRILDTNGVPSGLQPWQPGEWGGLLK